MNWKTLTVAFLIFYGLLVCLAGRYNDVPRGEWNSEIYGDKAGYYLYLPATFIYGYHQNQFMEEMSARIDGARFTDGKLFIKYTMGVAILYSPFFFISHLIAWIAPGPADGFAGIYYEMTYFGSVFYFLLGGLILFLFLRRRHSGWVSGITVIVFMFGSNLFYYALREPLMSHVYSFFLFSLLLWLTENLWAAPDRKKFYVVAVVSAFIVLIRPVNALFLLVVPIMGLSSWHDLKYRLWYILSPVNLAGALLLGFLVLLPQLIYWKFLSGSFLFYSYEGEGFTHWDNPQLIKVLFSPKNGLLPYSPSFVIALAGFVVMFFRREKDAWLSALIFCSLLYMSASWHAFQFGCGFGHRPATEYYALFSLPAASFFNLVFRKLYPFLMILMVVLSVYLIYVNLSLTSVFPKCHWGEDWEWMPYMKYFDKARIFPFHLRRNYFSWKDDFEQPARLYYTRVNRAMIARASSGEHVSRIDQSQEYSDTFGLDLRKLPAAQLLRVQVDFKCYFSGTPGKTLVVCSVEEKNEIFFYQAQRFDDRPGINPGTWLDIRQEFDMNYFKPRGFLKVYVWKMEGGEMYVDDLAIRMSVR